MASSEIELLVNRDLSFVNPRLFIVRRLDCLECSSRTGIDRDCMMSQLARHQAALFKRYHGAEC